MSAATPEGLRAAADQLARALAEHPEAAPPAPPAGERHRLAIIARDAEHARALLANPAPALVATSEVTAAAAGSLVFLFPGVGDQRAGMARAAYDTMPDFRSALDECAELLMPDLGTDIREALFSTTDAASATDLIRTRIAQPLVFAVEYALATLLRRWGLHPSAMLGYSVGEYAAACIAGVLDLPDALHLLARRAELIEAAPRGSMLLVQLGPDALSGYLTDGVSLAAVNGPSVCVAAGPTEAVERLERTLLSQAVPAMRVKSEHAFHSPMMAPIVAPLLAELGKVSLRPAGIPFLSNVSGGWIDDAATTPTYWAQHLTQPVRFTDNVAQMWQLPSVLAVETGPGQMLCSLANLHPDRPTNTTAHVVPALSRMASPHGEVVALLTVAAQAWVRGFPVDWHAVSARTPGHPGWPGAAKPVRRTWPRIR
ncbi:acyltransferase domain-containing protein [Micromonospora sp. WMMC273]|uniref:acyltransferase domain-containing protein n=1 Tax=Micromonospora sp. WMMC273 TaxID=3015157 RepID=UPI0022B6178E|nr:acyltransferase domain-containing protein [Micromonospora sp. WMMC273]MCZ7476255.1 acyltransferase domain-containing protein [Micromonospora sp. WMMC273]